MGTNQRAVYNTIYNAAAYHTEKKNVSSLMATEALVHYFIHLIFFLSFSFSYYYHKYFSLAFIAFTLAFNFFSIK